MAAGSRPKGVRSIRVMFFVTVFFWFVSFSPGLSEFSIETWTFTYTFPSLVQRYWRWPLLWRDRAWYTRVVHLYVRSSGMYTRHSGVRWRTIIWRMVWIWHNGSGFRSGPSLLFQPHVTDQCPFAWRRHPGFWHVRGPTQLGLEYRSCSSNWRATRSFSASFSCAKIEICLFFSTLSLPFVGFRLFGVRHDILLWWHQIRLRLTQFW